MRRMKTLRIGMGQILVEGGRRTANLNRAAGMVARAGEDGCDVVVLPECLDLGWTHPSARESAAPIPGPSSDALADAAADAGVWLVAGIVERAGARLYNTALLISPDREIVLKHHKVNELKLAHDLYAQGSAVGAADTPLGRIGVNICADNFPDAPELGSALGRMGCRLLLSPCAWAVDGDHDNERDPYGGMWVESYTKLATTYGMTVVGVSCVGPLDAGPWAGRKCIGRSVAVGPDGAILAHLSYGERAEELGVVEIALDDADSFAGVSAIAASRT